MKQLLPLCSIPKLAMRDGWAGANAHIQLPFYGLWFASGQQYTFPSSTIPQYAGRGLVGRRMPNTYKKDCCTCLSA